MIRALKIYEASLLYANARDLWRQVPEPSYDRPTIAGLQMLEAFSAANDLVPEWYVRMRGRRASDDGRYGRWGS